MNHESLENDCLSQPGEGNVPGEVFLFTAVPLGGPVEELRAAWERRMRTHTLLEEVESSERLTRALHLAEAALEAVLVGRGERPRIVEASEPLALLPEAETAAPEIVAAPVADDAADQGPSPQAAAGS